MLVLKPMTETVQIAMLQDKQKGNINSKPCSGFACVALEKKTHLCYLFLSTSFLKLFPVFFMSLVVTTVNVWVGLTGVKDPMVMP